jgi:flavin reductase (DIM6/NTAB) family NADH-FMN oxidoreductase RutF
MVAFDPPMIGFGCNVAHRTYANVVAMGDFVVNVLPCDLAPTAWGMPGGHGAQRIEHAQLRLRPATTVTPQVVADCVAHLECTYDRTVEFGHGEVFVFGRIVAADIDERCLVDDPAVAYRCLDPCFFLQDNLFAALGHPTSTRPQPI